MKGITLLTINVDGHYSGWTNARLYTKFKLMKIRIYTGTAVFSIQHSFCYFCVTHSIIYLTVSLNEFLLSLERFILSK